MIFKLSQNSNSIKIKVDLEFLYIYFLYIYYEEVCGNGYSLWYDEGSRCEEKHCPNGKRYLKCLKLSQE